MKVQISNFLSSFYSTCHLDLTRLAIQAHLIIRSWVVSIIVHKEVRKVQCTFQVPRHWIRQKQAIKIPEGALKSSLGTLPHPPPSPSPSLSSSLSQSSPPLLFLSIVSTKHPIQAPMTSLTADSGRLNEQWPHGNKSQFIRLESEGETD